MAEFTVLVLKIAFLAIVWLFIVFIASVVNSDMVGRRQRTQASVDSAWARKRKNEPWVLAIDSGAHAGDRLQLVPKVRIGRSDACELVLSDDYVSSMHAILSRQDNGTWVIRDLGSTNGTYVNGNRLQDPTIVGPADIIRVGEVQMRLEL
ncbi:MAG: FHA domain-containing protein [Propionibacteriaceae bacterium]|jgi:hypothetical protein|nr:FHA domain-containing protein [Propionibacteriaceae bacterium]